MNTETDIPEFGIKRENEERRDGGCAVVFDPQTQMYAVGRQSEMNRLRLFSGGVDPHEDIVKGIIREVEEESGLYNFRHVENIGMVKAHFFNVLKKVNRVCHATCLLLVLETRDTKDVKLEAHETFSLDWVTGDELIANFHKHNKNKDVDHWIYFLDKANGRLKELGYLK